MTENELNKTVLNLAAPLVAALGLEIWGLEIVPGGRIVVRLFVDLPACDNADAAPADGPVPERSPTIDQCEEISRQLGLALDVEDCISGPWRLEVSTPGLSRRFYRIKQMRPFVGDVVEARLTAALPGAERRAYRGILRSVSNDSFIIEPCSVSDEGLIACEGTAPVELPWRLVARVQRHYVFARPARPGKPQGRKKTGQKPATPRPPEVK